MRRARWIVPGSMAAGLVSEAVVRTLQGRAELARTRTALEQLTHRAAEAEATAARQSARLVHDLRTPLNAIIGFAELLADEAVGPITTSQRECLSDIGMSARELLGRVEQLAGPQRRTRAELTPSDRPRLTGPRAQR